MTLYKGKYRIESARLPGWDYSSPGYYFLTICTHNRECLFGNIADKKMYLNEFGTIAQDEWDKSFVIRRELLPDEFIVMPNHFHGIVRLFEIGDQIDVDVVETSGRTSLPDRTVPEPAERQPQRQTIQIRPKSVSSFMAGVKSVITKRINEIRKTPGVPVLQSRFHDHIIRDEYELFRIRQYIKNNPLSWDRDKLNGGTGDVIMEPVTPYGDEPWMI